MEADDTEAKGGQEGLAAPSYEAVSFQIISFAGTAKSLFLEAIEAVKRGEDPQPLLDEGDAAYRSASEAHQRALVQEAEGTLGSGLLLIHAETILSSAETIRNLATTIIDLIPSNRDGSKTVQ